MTLIEETTPADYYASLTERNRGLISDSGQAALAAATVVVAGCGSTGGAVVDPLVRLGVQHFALAEPGDYELNNLNRQDASLLDIGRNKAVVAAERIRAVNPHATVRVETTGVLAGTVQELLADADVVVDGVDVTTRAGWVAKFLLHRVAAEKNLPVISGYDMSGTQYVRYYDYRTGLAPLAGEITEDQLETTSVWDLLLAVVPRTVVPADLIADIRAHREEPEYSVPQLVYTSMLFGVLTARYVVEVLSGNPVQETLCLDVHQIVRG